MDFRGNELLAKIAMPLLFLFAVFLVIRIFTLGTPVHPNNSPLTGLAFLREPEFLRFLDLDIWFSAAGQMFFTLSLGMGAILTYASYLRENDDVALSGLTTASTNEFAEVIKTSPARWIARGYIIIFLIITRILVTGHGKKRSLLYERIRMGLLNPFLGDCYRPEFFLLYKDFKMTKIWCSFRHEIIKIC